MLLKPVPYSPHPRISKTSLPASMISATRTRRDRVHKGQQSCPRRTRLRRCRPTDKCCSRPPSVPREVQQEIQSLDYSIGQAIAGAKVEIFRFLKLPIELRVKVYEFVLLTDKKWWGTPALEKRYQPNPNAKFDFAVGL